MATLIGDYASDHSRFHHAIMPSYQQQSQQQQQEPRYRSSSHSRDAATRQASSSPNSRRARSTRTPVLSSATTRSPMSKESQLRREREIAIATADSITDASRFPTPPDSSSPGSATSASGSTSNLAQTHSEHDQGGPYMAVEDTFPSHDSSSTSSTHTIIPPPATTQRPPHSIPSPASDRNLPWAPDNNSNSLAPAATTSTTTLQASPTQKVIHVQDLAHIQRLANSDAIGENGPGISDDPPLQEMKFEISAMPIGDIIEMVAALLTKITTTNDLQHDALTRNVTHQRQAQAQNEGSDAQSSPFSTSVLAFHGKNVPAITILSYLTRIHKYCPTTYEVFLSLLVYFDRMTERVNERVMKDEETRRQNAKAQSAASAQDTAMAEAGAADEVDEDLADSDDEGSKQAAANTPAEAAMDAAVSAATYFVVDSFNIHRLIIAGVTCASKFFSDVFYTNSRYAKVGGLPLPELNHLELQFLLLNDFRLAVPVEDLEGYATMLVEFYAREVVAQRSRPAASG